MITGFKLLATLPDVRAKLLLREEGRNQGVRMPVSDLVLDFEEVDEFHVLQRARTLENFHPMRYWFGVSLFDGREI
jgi:hypothetical protein